MTEHAHATIGAIATYHDPAGLPLDTDVRAAPVDTGTVVRLRGPEHPDAAAVGRPAVDRLALDGDIRAHAPDAEPCVRPRGAAHARRAGPIAADGVSDVADDVDRRVGARGDHAEHRVVVGDVLERGRRADVQIATADDHRRTVIAGGEDSLHAGHGRRGRARCPTDERGQERTPTARGRRIEGHVAALPARPRRSWIGVRTP